MLSSNSQCNGSSDDEAERNIVDGVRKRHTLGPIITIIEHEDANTEKKFTNKDTRTIILCFLTAVVVTCVHGTGLFNHIIIHTMMTAPTPTPVPDDRGTAITKYINSITYIGSGIPPGSPEANAIEWIINEDPLHLSADISEDKDHIKQRYALLTMWFQAQDHSEPYIGVTNWLIGNECDWDGIDCDPYNNVINLSLYYCCYGGTIPPDLALLESLQKLELYENLLTGSIPPSIGKLTKLQHFDANDDNELTGTLPSSIGNLSMLKYFGIGGNCLNGTLPESIGNWTNIVDVSFNNAFSGTIPSTIGNWTNIEHVAFKDAFSGTIPSTIVNWSKIKTADFSGTKLVGTMPLCNNSSYTFSELERLEADCSKVTCLCCTRCFEHDSNNYGYYGDCQSYW